MISLTVAITQSVAVAICIAAVITDHRTRRIPNYITFSGIIAGFAINLLVKTATQGIVYGLLYGLFPSFIGFVFLFLIFLFLNGIGMVGMGDVKLMGAVGAFLGWPESIRVLLCVMLCGGVLAFFYAVKTKKVNVVLKNMGSIAQKKVSQHQQGTLSTHKMPYGIAILAGTVTSIIYGYLF